MTDQVIIVPKLDGVTAVLHVFGLERGTPASERLSNDVQLWRVPVAGDTTMALGRDPFAWRPLSNEEIQTREKRFFDQLARAGENEIADWLEMSNVTAPWCNAA